LLYGKYEKTVGESLPFFLSKNSCREGGFYSLFCGFIMRAKNYEGRLSVDWKRIKAEYIAGGTSYRKLAEKYGEPRSNIERRAKAEKWTELRRHAEGRAEAKIIDSVSNKEAKKAVDIIDVADKLLGKIVEIAEMVSDPDSIKKLTSAIKDIKDIKGVKSADDIAEQRARIEKLRKECERDDEKNLPSLVIEGLPEEFKR
jgi:hypothetical protein